MACHVIIVLLSLADVGIMHVANDIIQQLYV